VLPYQETNYGSDGYIVDESRFSVIMLPDSTLICVESASGPMEPRSIHCLRVPFGTVLLIPTPPDSI
jgi:hypothetical protein